MQMDPVGAFDFSALFLVLSAWPFLISFFDVLLGTTERRRVPTNAATNGGMMDGATEPSVPQNLC